MRSWHLIAPKELKEVDDSLPPLGENEARVKISDVLLSPTDYKIYDGTSAASFPLIPGRFAIGKIVSLPGDVQKLGNYSKGERVFLIPHFIDEDFCEDSTPLQGAQSVKVAGIHRDGFATTFVNMPFENIIPIPESVSDHSALFCYHLSLAISAIDRLGELKDKRIAVAGAGILGIILCKLLSYYQAVPILFDAHPSYLEFARQNGVPYAFLNNDSLDSSINSITGGAFADGAIYAATDNASISSAVFRITAPNKNVVFCGFRAGALQASLKLALEKQLHIFGSSDASKNLSTAINLLATKAIDLDMFHLDVYDLSALPKAYTKESEYEAPHERLSLIDCYGQL